MARFKETVALRQVPTSTGAVQGALSLSDRFAAFEQLGSQVAQIGIQKAEKAAVERGIASGQAVQLEKRDGKTIAPKFKEKKFIGGIEIEAHNKALRASYLASLNNDIRTDISRIQAENKDNLVGFNESVKGWAKGILEGVDPSVRNIVQTKIEDRVVSSRISVQEAAIKRQNEEAAKQLEISSQTTLDDAFSFASNGDLLSADEALLDYGNILVNQVEAGYMLPAEAQEKIRDAKIKVVHENMVGSIRKLSNTGQTIEAADLIQRAQQKIPKGMSVEDHQDLTRAMVAELSEGISINNRLEKDQKTQLTETQSRNYGRLASGMAKGAVNINTIIRSYKNGEIDETQQDKLISTLNSRGRGSNNYRMINDINESIRAGESPDSIRNDIINNTGINLTEKTAASLLSSLNASLDKESVLNVSTVKRARDFITPSIRVVGPLGALDSEAEARLARSIREFDTRVLEGEDAWAVADELVGKDRFERAPNPMFGTKDTLDQSLEKLNDALINKQVTEEDYNYEFELINRLSLMKENIKAFDNARKETDANTVR